jgi:ribonucleotide reductase beta subunit family protein with ferritin-like domain
MFNENEPLLKDNPGKHVLFPIKHKDLWSMCELHEKVFWFPNEVDLSNDAKDWRKLSGDEQYFIKHILAFFAASDGIIMENISVNFADEIQFAESRAFYATQAHIESIHSEVYSRLLFTYISDAKEQNHLRNAVQTIPTVKKKAEWAKKWISTDYSFATRLIGFIIVEGLFFSGAFCSIYWIKDQKKGLLKGLCQSNEFIARDEGLHVNFASLQYNSYVVNKLSQNKITEIITEAVDIEKEFIIDALKCDILGMNSGMMIEYIEFVAHNLVARLGYDSPYKNAKNPFKFMDKICMQNLTSFFDTRVTEYQRTILGEPGAVGEVVNSHELDDDDFTGF